MGRLSGGQSQSSLRRNPVDAETAKRLGIKLNQLIVSNWLWALKPPDRSKPNKQVEVTVPISRATVVELLVAVFK